MVQHSINITFALCLTALLSCSSSSEMNVVEVAQSTATPVTVDSTDTPFNGVSFVAPVRKVDASVFDAVVDANANWVTLMPYSYNEDGGKVLKWDSEWQWWGERVEGNRICIEMAKSKGLQVMVKPHVWLRHGSYTGDMKMDNEADWVLFEQSFEKYILQHAKASEEAKADAFCIGTEWKNFVAERPEFWEQLIAKVRKEFSGKLTYAGNWDAYRYFPHWDKLDYVGVDAYFPLSDAQNPTVEELKEGWQKSIDQLAEVHKQTGKPIIFTEWGYRSMDYVAKEPWETGKGNTVNQQAQANAYEAMFQTVGQQEWFKGGFVWKWFGQQEKAGGLKNNQFTPQNKPAQKVLEKYFAQ